MENNKNLYVLIFQIAVQYSSELEKLWFTGFSGNLSKWEYGNGNKNTKKNKELHIVFYKYYERFKDATINPKRIAATHYISISLDNYYGYLYDVGSALNSLLEERIELNTI
jgi:hypothetical protein